MNYSNIIPYDFACGEGVRCSLFVSGCRFNCPNCFNKEAQDYNYGNPFTVDKYNDIIKIIKKPQVVGLSLLGGDPMWQDSIGIMLMCALCDITHKCGKNVWLWSGFTYEEIMNNGTKEQMDLLQHCDVFVDGRYIDSLKDTSLKWRGSSNQRIIDVNKSISKGTVVPYYDD